jgi:signal recognition particle receptor subunit beta
VVEGMLAVVRDSVRKRRAVEAIADSADTPTGLMKVRGASAADRRPIRSKATSRPSRLCFARTLDQLREPHFTNGASPMKTVVLGPPLAGKTTCIHALARALKGTVRHRKLAVPDHPSGFERALGFSVATGAVEEDEEAWWTIPANAWAPSAWDELVREARGVVLVLDAHPVRAVQNAEAIAHLRDKELDGVRGSVVVTKADILGKAEAQRQRDRLLERTPMLAWPMFFHTSATSDEERAGELCVHFETRRTGWWNSMLGRAR